MRRRRLTLQIPVLLVTFAGATSPTATQQPETGARSTLEGVFTAEQAARGQARFRTSCAECHPIEQFTSPGLFRAWDGRPIRELLVMVSTLMPENDPGGLDPQDYVDVMAYLLAENGYPAGERELPPDDDELRRIRVDVETDAGTGRGRTSIAIFDSHEPRHVQFVLLHAPFVDSPFARFRQLRIRLPFADGPLRRRSPLRGNPGHGAGGTAISPVS